jgi:hypothetical protein
MLIFLRSQREFCEGFFRTAGRPRISRLNAQQSQPSGSTLPQCSPDRSRPLAIYSTQRRGYGSGASTVSTLPLACAVAVIRWGADASSDRLRQRARCTSCGNKGATIQHPAGAVMTWASCRTRHDAGSTAYQC